MHTVLRVTLHDCLDPGPRYETVQQLTPAGVLEFHPQNDASRDVDYASLCTSSDPMETDDNSRPHPSSSSRGYLS
jgi:hypothetical protein